MKQEMLLAGRALSSPQPPATIPLLASHPLCTLRLHIPYRHLPWVPAGERKQTCPSWRFVAPRGLSQNAGVGETEAPPTLTNFLLICSPALMKRRPASKRSPKSSVWSPKVNNAYRLPYLNPSIWRQEHQSFPKCHVPYSAGPGR